MNSLIHLTINTGHSRTSVRAEIGAAAIELLAPLLSPGEHPLPADLAEEYRLVVPETQRYFVGTLYRGAAPLVTIGVARDAGTGDELWLELERMYLWFTDRSPGITVGWAPPRKPESAPWCAVVIVIPPSIEESNWVGDFERCLAWAWLESSNAS